MQRRMKVWLLVLVVALVGSGCALTSGGPYKEACLRFGTAGSAIERDLTPPTTEAQKMKYQAFRDAVAECLRLGKGE